MTDHSLEHTRIPCPVGTFDAIAAGPEDGRQVLLLHGFPQASMQWTHQVAALGAAGYRAVAPDQRGYSPQVRPERVEDYRMSELVADVLAMADSLGWRRFDLVGHDWGSAVAWTVAAEHPERVRTLTAVSVPHPTGFAQARKEDPDQELRSRYITVFQRAGEAERRLLADNATALRRVFEWKVPPSHVDEYVARMSEPGALTAALNWYRAMKYGERVGPVAVPTLYVWSTEDSAVGSTAALGNEKWVTGSYRFEMLEDVSHWIPEEAADALTGLILEHLAAHSG
ncbi:alpha/beta fold hydrolase [Goodfellowiella coeruleoviolacea]|uniref:Pimeloyl-ACP methyl ester carboxylesterase n=1 Tax=Goodfellowiella coeruleoviolacea TaxID=334858 RepID=A0AAE3GJP5_9PSEU|nr:alpha/beta hydrolase [Goodfellowiella coeruleoviolacea]MCP2169450.1 Pimeloyl-ACP methyl ester carboxylesterase [Goodfellowiella coeruleoviolacea]